MVQRSSYRRRNCARTGRNFHNPAVSVVPHQHAIRVARQALGRFRGNVRAVLEHSLARRVGVGQHGRVDVNHDLIALAWSAGIERVVQRSL